MSAERMSLMFDSFLFLEVKFVNMLERGRVHWVKWMSLILFSILKAKYWKTCSINVSKMDISDDRFVSWSQTQRQTWHSHLYWQELLIFYSIPAVRQENTLDGRHLLGTMGQYSMSWFLKFAPYPQMLTVLKICFAERNKWEQLGCHECSLHPQ